MSNLEVNAIVTQRIEVTDRLIKLRIIPEGWELPDFIPGQYGVLGLPGTAPRCDLAETEDPPPADPQKLIRRAYSIASSSVTREYIEFFVGLVESGALSPRLMALKPGDPVFMGSKFKGMFTLSDVPNEFGVILAATGTGVAPYMSMIRTEVNSGLRRRVAVIHGAMHSVDLGYQDELKMLDAVSDSFTYLPILSHAHEEKREWSGYEGFVQKLWADGVLKDLWGAQPTPADTHAFLCGNPLMIEAMVELLTKDGFVEHTRKVAGQVHVEKFFVQT